MRRALLLFLLLLTTSANAKGPFGSINVGNWVGGGYTDDNTGAFTHCAANASYQAAVLFVALGAAGDWKLAFRNEAWNLTTGEGIPIDLTFDGQSQFHVFGQAHDPHFVIVVMPPTASLMRAFRKAQLMSAFAKGQTFPFALTSTDRLMSALSECRQTLLAHGMSAVRDFGNQKSQQATVAVPPVASLTPPPQSGPQFRDDAIELATNFILKTGLRNPHLLTKADTPIDLVSNGAAWKADDAGGFVRIIQGDMKGIDVATAVAAGDAKECTGKFASGRVSELVDSDVVFRGFASCEDSDGSRIAQYFIVPWKRGGFIIFSVISNMKTEPAREAVKDERLTDYRKAALTAVSLQQ